MSVAKWSRLRSPVLVTGAALALVGLLGVVDYQTGWEYSFSVFYLLPIFLAAWVGGLVAGLLVSLASAATWLAADLLWDYHLHVSAAYWNATVRLGFFVIVTAALSSLRAARERREELFQFIVHDLRSPLSNVMAALRLLPKQAANAGNDEETDLVGIGLTSAQRMLTLVDSLLDVPRLESGKLPLERRGVPVAELVSGAVAQVSLLARLKRVSVAVGADDEVDTVYADSHLTSRVLANLLSNALKFAPSDSTVHVRTRRLDTDEAAFSVRDEGPGVPGEWAGRVFDKYGQVTARKAGGSVGSGLGLTFCKLAVEAQGGRIWLESEEDEGMTVTFTLPAGADR